MLIKPTEQSWWACRRASSEFLAKLRIRSSLVRPGRLDRHDVDLRRQAALGPALGIEVNAVPGPNQVPAQIRDVSLGASSRGINPLKVQGQVHGFDLPRYPESGLREPGNADLMLGLSAMPHDDRQSHSTISSYRSSQRSARRVFRAVVASAFNAACGCAPDNAPP